MRTVIVTVLCCVWVVIFAGIGVYMFDAPRAWMVHLLSPQEAAVVTASSSAPATTPDLTVVASTTASAAPGGVASSSLSGISPVNSTPVFDGGVYQYKLFSGVAPCQLNQLGADGWHPIQLGGTLVSVYGGDASCKKFGITDALDWALFERHLSPAQ